MEEPGTASATHNMSATSEQMDTISTSVDQTFINKNQTSELETPETDPVNESVNTDDLSSHSSAATWTRGSNTSSAAHNNRYQI